MQLISDFLGYFNTPASIWMGLGALIIFLEIFTAPGIGMVFAGMGAITTGLALQWGFVSDHSAITQGMVWFASTLVWSVILWKPLRGVRKNKKNERTEFKNIIGDRAVVTFKQLEKGMLGRVKWSGTIMQARMVDSDTLESIPEGAEVEIVATEGNVLIVKHLKS